MTARLPRIICDTSVLISAAIQPESTSARAFQHSLRTGDLLASKETIAEFLAVLQRSKFDRYFKPGERAVLLHLLQGSVAYVQIRERVRLCRDPRDDKFLDLAIAGDAQFLITGDADLLALDPFRSTRILTAAEYLTQAS